MDNDNMLIICRSCGRKVLMHNMRPDKDGEHMICVDCYRKQAGISSAVNIFGKEHIENTSYQPTKSAKSAPTKSDKLVRYICTNCKYTFSRKASQEVAKCPYCGKNSIVVDSQLGADKLLNDSMDKKFETW